MIKFDELRNYCMEKEGAYEDFPFGEVPVCYKLGGKIFAQIYPLEDDYKITLKCSAEEGDFFRHMYPGGVVRGYHCPPVQQPHLNTVYISKIPEEELLNMIDLAYLRVFQSFSKKRQKEFAEKFGFEI